MLRYGTIQGDGRVKVGAYGNFCNWHTWHDFYSTHHFHLFLPVILSHFLYIGRQCIHKIMPSEEDG